MRVGLLLLVCAVGCGDKGGDAPAATGAPAADKPDDKAEPAKTAAPEEKKPVDARAACEALAKEIGGTGCKEDKPGGLGAAAWAKYVFDLEEPKGKTCQVLSFKKAADLESTEKAFDGAAALAGPHRYASKSALIYVQCNEGMPRPTGEKLEVALKKL